MDIEEHSSSDANESKPEYLTSTSTNSNESDLQFVLVRTAESICGELIQNN